MTKDSEHLQWIHDRLKNIHGERENYDYMWRLREIIGHLQRSEANVLLISGSHEPLLGKMEPGRIEIVDEAAESSRLDAESLRQRVPPVKP